MWSNPRRRYADEVTGTNVTASTRERSPPYRAGTVSSASRAAQCMMHAISVDSRRSPPVLVRTDDTCGRPIEHHGGKTPVELDLVPLAFRTKQAPIRSSASRAGVRRIDAHHIPQAGIAHQGTGRLATRAARGREQLQRLLGKLPQEPCHAPTTRSPPPCTIPTRRIKKPSPVLTREGVPFHRARLLSRHPPIRSAVPQNRSRPPHPAWAYDASDGGASWAHPQRCQKSRRNGFAPLYLPHHPGDGAEP